MAKLWAIIKREYLERVRTKWFIFATVFGPIFFGAMIVISGIVQIVNIGMTIFSNTAERRRAETLKVAEAIAPPPVAN